ncbi:MAG: flagella basal body P-ring formation protein FlgA [Armatimonadota bacterium]
MSLTNFRNLGRTAMPLAMLIAALAATAVWADEPQAVVTLRAEAAVDTAHVLLGQVADIQATSEMTARLHGVSLSSSPLPDRTRSIEAGYIKLRLRRFGVDPAQVDLRGETVVVRRSRMFQIATSEAASGATGDTTTTEPALVRQGQLVDVEVRCGGVTIRTTGVACRDGAAGHLIDLRLEKLNRKLPARITGPGRVLLTISERMP